MGLSSIWHWIIVLVIVLLVFGTKRLTGGAKDVGNAFREFKKGLSDEEQAASKLEQPASPAETVQKTQAERDAR